MHRAVVFDMGGVLLPAPFQVFADFEKRFSIPVRSVLAEIAKEEESGSWHRLERGELTSENFNRQFSQILSQKLGKPLKSDEFMDVFGQSNRARPLMLSAVKKLRAAGFKTAVLTNNWFTSPGRSLFPLDRSLFDAVVESCVEGVRKPDTKIYEILLSRLCLSAGETVFLDDIGRNLKVARQMGIHTIKVNNPNFEEALRELENVVGVSLLEKVRGTSEVPAHHQFDLDRLVVYVRHLKLFDIPPDASIAARYFVHGQSNPTFHVDLGCKEMVLRKKPPGKLLPSAHAVDREYRVMRAVHEAGVPVPTPLHYCDDGSVIGTPFYLMEYQRGPVFDDILLADHSSAQRKHIYEQMSQVLAAIHNVNLSSARLDDYGKKGEYVMRNLDRWKRQYDASLVDNRSHPEVEKLYETIASNLPRNEQCTLVHGDFRLDNLIFEAEVELPSVTGVIDWELSTLGDPLVDLATNCLPYYFDPGTAIIGGFKGLDLSRLGIPSLNEYIALYCKLRGRSIDEKDVLLTSQVMAHWHIYMAFVCFRFAAIIQGVFARSKIGQASGKGAEEMGAFVPKLARVGLDIANKTDSNSGPSSPSCVVTGGSLDGMSGRVKELHSRVTSFVRDRIIPLEQPFLEHANSQDKWRDFAPLERIKEAAKMEGLWNLFIPLEVDAQREYGAGLTNLEYAHLCEVMGQSFLAPQVFNCNAPDTGNMEVLIRYGSEEQKERWLKPLLDGSIRSCFGMTEPQVASSDARNIEASIVRDGDEYVINAHKWWTSGAMSERCELCILMGKTDPAAHPLRQQSMVLVPMRAPGVKVIRALTVFGFDDAPEGHAEVTFTDVRVPVSSVVLGEGRGFEIAQGRLGPGRIHHCMRLIGMAERSLALMVQRASSRVAFGKRLADQGSVQHEIARSRIDIEQTRLLVLHAAHKMDTVGNKVAAPEIAMIKVAAPQMTQRVVDRSIQVHGGAGLSQDFPLAAFFTWARVLRLADGPDEVHLRSVAGFEMKKQYEAHKL